MCAAGAALDTKPLGTTPRGFGVLGQNHRKINSCSGTGARRSWMVRQPWLTRALVDSILTLRPTENPMTQTRAKPSKRREVGVPSRHQPSKAELNESIHLPGRSPGAVARNVMRGGAPRREPEKTDS